MQKLGPDGLACWDFGPRGMHTGWNHYPGVYFAQFMAYYNDRAGLYLAMDDTAGHVKRFKPIHREPGIRFGIAHVGDWPQHGRRALGYDVLLGSFAGDWWDAAGIYREWSLRQKWAVPLPQKKVPAWLTDSPVYITIRPQGILDSGPVHPVKEFLPYEKCLPMLEKIAKAVNAPLSVILMGWERAGSWVYPDCFPPVGGQKSMRNFISLVRQRGWHAGSFCNGTRWVTSHNWKRITSIRPCRESGWRRRWSSLLAKNTDNWADWEPRVGNNDYALAMIRAVTALRRGAGRDFLVYGRMQRPCAISGVRVIKWTWQDRRYEIPAVFHGCWTAPDGRYAVTLANWTARPQRVTVRDVRLEPGMLLYTATKGVKTEPAPVRRHCLTMKLPPHSMALVALAGAE
jgi:hypothetical protein